MTTRSRQQDDDIEAGVIHNEGFIAGALHRTTNGEEEALPLRPMSNEGTKRNFSTRRK